MSKESFKLFVRNHPSLANYVATGEMTWQKFYEMYDMYGENSIIWDPYRTVKKQQTTQSGEKSLDSTFKDMVQMIKGIDLESVRKGIDGVQKAIGLVQELSNNKQTKQQPKYEPRPMYKYFED